MEFSVVITTYNRRNLLQRAIHSALNQTIQCEVVVADDCSSDDTQDYVTNLCTAFQSASNSRKVLGQSLCSGSFPNTDFAREHSAPRASRLVYHRNEVNKGHAATVNAGVLKASGDWIKFLDDDDYLDPHCLEEMAKAIALCPSAAICSSIAAQVNEMEVELSRTPQLGPGLAFYTPQTDLHYGMLLELLPLGTPVQVSTRRDAFLQSGGWNSEFDANCDDIDSWIRIAQFGDAIFLNQCLAYRTIWSGAYNQKFSLQKRLDTNISIKKKIYNLVTEKHRSKLPAFKDIESYLKLHWTLVALKQRKIHDFLYMLYPTIFSFNAWRILLTAVLFRRNYHNNSDICKFVLIEL
ncbi:MAG: glycosyltransferase family 2 protein [Rhizonema sp. NSF051]|nr:glycosyltransferase family 2 protein [Rhizonema sp. NSF051]